MACDFLILNSYILTKGFMEYIMMTGYGDHGWGMIWLEVIGLVVVLAVVSIAIKSMNRNNNNQPGTEKTPFDILRERYARGELSKEEFEERRKTLMQ